MTGFVALVAVLLAGAFFGFFFAWSCAVMWGLDGADPRAAIAAMQAVNGAVRNALFAPVFFGTVPVLAATSILAALSARGAPATWFGAAALAAAGVIAVTVIVHIPMNEDLGAREVPGDAAAAQAMWQAYSPRWQAWNHVRTAGSGVALAFAAVGLRVL